MTGFGRKGLDTTAGSAQADISSLRNPARGATLTRPSGFAVPANDELARKREAFIAAERARSAQTDEALAVSGRSGASSVVLQRSLPVAYLAWFLLGAISAHRFYLGAYQSAVFQIGILVVGFAVSLGAVGGGGESIAYLGFGILGIWAVWVLGDVFVIHSIHRKHCRGTRGAAAAFA